eukprot:1793995-Lingulodinium_polyedra.AAC.1
MERVCRTWLRQVPRAIAIRREAWNLGTTYLMVIFHKAIHRMPPIYLAQQRCGLKRRAYAFTLTDLVPR